MAYDEAAGPSGSVELTEATATTGASHDANGVKFNNKNYEDWSEALLAVRQLVNKNKDDERLVPGRCYLGTERIVQPALQFVRERVFDKKPRQLLVIA
jgi:hypothetical protein